MPERKFLYQVTIRGIGTSTPILAVDEFQAIEVAYSQYQHLEADRKKYTAKRKKM